MRQDLFSEKLYIEDPALVHELAAQRLDKLSEAMRIQGWKSVETFMQLDWTTRQSFIQKCESETLTPNPEEAKAIEDIEAQISAVYETRDKFEETIGDEYTGEQADRLDWFSELIDGLLDFKEALFACLEDWYKAQEQGATVVVDIGRDGELEIIKGVVPRSEFESTSGHQGYGAPVTKPKERAEFSEKLMTSLTAHRTAALQAALFKQPKIALALLTSQLASQVLGERYDRISSPAIVNATVSDIATLESRALGFESTVAATFITAEYAECRTLYEQAENFTSVLEWCLQLDDEQLRKIFTFCVSQTIDTISGRASAVSPETATLMEVLNLDMAEWWQTSEANYLALVSKAQISEAVREASKAATATPVDGMKKGDAVKYAEEHLKGKGWLPKPLRKIVTDAK